MNREAPLHDTPKMKEMGIINTEFQGKTEREMY
jgi:hypothetical protein